MEPIVYLVGEFASGIGFVLLALRVQIPVYVLQDKRNVLKAREDSALKVSDSMLEVHVAPAAKDAVDRNMIAGPSVRILGGRGYTFLVLIDRQS